MATLLEEICFPLGVKPWLSSGSLQTQSGCEIYNFYIKRFSSATCSILPTSSNCKIVIPGVLSHCNQTELSFQPHSTKKKPKTLQSNIGLGPREVYNLTLICDTFEFDIHKSVLVSSRPPVMSVTVASVSFRLVAEIYSIWLLFRL